MPRTYDTASADLRDCLHSTDCEGPIYLTKPSWALLKSGKRHGLDGTIRQVEEVIKHLDTMFAIMVARSSEAAVSDPDLDSPTKCKIAKSGCLWSIADATERKLSRAGMLSPSHLLILAKREYVGQERT